MHKLMRKEAEKWRTALESSGHTVALREDGFPDYRSPIRPGANLHGGYGCADCGTFWCADCNTITDITPCQLADGKAHFNDDNLAPLTYLAGLVPGM